MDERIPMSINEMDDQNQNNIEVNEAEVQAIIDEAKMIGDGISQTINQYIAQRLSRDGASKSEVLISVSIGFADSVADYLSNLYYLANEQKYSDDSNSDNLKFSQQAETLRNIFLDLAESYVSTICDK